MAALRPKHCASLSVLRDVEDAVALLVADALRATFTWRDVVLMNAVPGILQTRPPITAFAEILP
jgi:hypothetical protein